MKEPLLQAARVNRSTLRDQVVGLIREAILSGRYEPGRRLSEPDVAREFEVSLTPVREALGSLASTGLVVRNGRQGTHVRKLNVSDVRNLFSVRESLECLAVRQAAGRLSKADFTQFASLLREQAEANDLVATSNALATRRLSDLNDAFHGLILARAENEWLDAMLASIGDLLVFARIRLRETAPPERRVQSLEEHREIVAALERGDDRRAAAVMAEHLRHLEQHVLAQMRSQTDGSDVDVATTGRHTAAAR